jgi:uncharacterized membrane protein
MKLAVPTSPHAPTLALPVAGPAAGPLLMIAAHAEQQHTPGIMRHLLLLAILPQPSNFAEAVAPGQPPPPLQQKQTQAAWAARRVLQWGGDDSNNDAAAGGCEERLRDSLGEIGELGANANIYVLHGSWMTATWSSCSLAGIFIARYCRHRDGWIDWHIKFQAIAAMGTCGFVAVAIAMVHEQMSGTHQKLGLLIGVWTVFQACAGDFIHQQPPGPKRHKLLTLLHKVGGKTLGCLSLANIWLGFRLLDVDSWMRVLWGTWIAVAVVAFGVAEVRLRRAAGEARVTQQELMLPASTGSCPAAAGGPDAAHRQLAQCTVHVRGIGGVAETEDKLRRCFAPFGRVAAVVVRRRVAADGGDSSWGLVTMATAGQAEAILDAVVEGGGGDRDGGGSPGGLLAVKKGGRPGSGADTGAQYLRVTRFDSRVADHSTGGARHLSFYPL